MHMNTVYKCCAFNDPRSTYTLLLCGATALVGVLLSTAALPYTLKVTMTGSMLSVNANIISLSHARCCPRYTYPHPRLISLHE